MTNDFQNTFVSKFELLSAQAVRFGLLRNQVALRDFEFLAFRVTRQPQHFQAILQCRRDCVQHVRGSDKENLRQIVFDVKVMILKHMVLLRIEDFEQRRARVAAKVRAQLVDLVEQQHGIHSAGFLHHLNDLAG